MKIRIVQPIIPEYRVALFAGLAKKFPGTVELCAAASIGESDRSYPVEGCMCDYTHVYRQHGPVVWQRGLTLKGLDPKTDVLVVNGDVRQLSTLWLILKAKLMGLPYVWWGHHFSASSKMWRAKMRVMMMRLLNPNAILLYTRSGISWMKAMGVSHVRMFATGNTIDQKPIEEACNAWTTDKLEDFRRKKGIADKLLLCCSVLREKVRLQQLLHAMLAPGLNRVQLVVIGDGPMRSAWQKEAEVLGLSSRIFWVPGTRDQLELAPWFLNADVYVYPGAIGLSILHSFSYGLPVLTHGNIAHQMPEFEVMEDGVTGRLFNEDDEDDLAQKISEMLYDHASLKCYSDNCRRLAFERYSMRNMIDNFAEAVEAVR